MTTEGAAPLNAHLKERNSNEKQLMLSDRSACEEHMSGARNTDELYSGNTDKRLR